MDDKETRLGFEAEALAGANAGEAEALARGVRADPLGSAASARRLAALFAHAAFAAPERIAAVYDAAAAGWFGTPVGVAPIAPPPVQPLALAPAFWTSFWGLVTDAGGNLEAGEVTVRTAALGGLLDPAYPARIAAACSAYPGVLEAARQGLPDRFSLESLAACPDGSLGEAFRRLIVDNGFDFEVLDRDALGLSDLTPPLDYLNTRMLQTHDLWHILAGYRTTKLHEVAISAFQMAQFGHGYSAMFLAMVATAASFRPDPSFSLLAETILSAWVHGRRTPSMLAIPWESIWDQPIEAIRRQFGVVAYPSPYPADLFEGA